MRGIKTKIFLSLLLLSFQIVKSQDTIDEKLTPAFFKTFKTDPIQAYTDLFYFNKWVQEANKSEIQTTQIKYKELLDQLGDYNGYILIAEKRVSDCLIIKRFLIKYARMPIRFTFVLYKFRDEWGMQDFYFDTDLIDEIKESTKVK